MNEDEIKQKLSDEEYEVLRKGSTEAAFSGEFVDTEDKGMYKCKVCGNELFSSESKFHSGSGWPSFDDVVNEGNVETKTDDSHGMQRTEVVCAKCKSHLGHVFDDGPAETTGKRYCINSVCLDLEKDEDAV